MDDLSNIVSTALEIIKEKLSINETVFNLWFGDFNLISLDDTKAVFTTRNNLRKNILTGKYIGVIEETLESLIGFKVKVEIRSLEDDEGNKPRRLIDEKFVLTGRENEDEERITDILNNHDVDKKSILDEYTFDNFIEGASNKFARAACFAVAKEPTTYNPLFIHGESGLGKTHLLYATMNYMRKNSPHLKI